MLKSEYKIKEFPVCKFHTEEEADIIRKFNSTGKKATMYIRNGDEFEYDTLEELLKYGAFDLGILVDSPESKVMYEMLDNLYGRVDYRVFQPELIEEGDEEEC